MITQSTFPWAWLIFQYILGGTPEKQKILLEHWNEGNRILEVGCSLGNVSRAFIDKDVNFTGIDICQPMIEIAKKRFKNYTNFHFYTTSIEEYSLSNNTFDCIFLAGILHHVDDSMALSILKTTKKLSHNDTRIVVSEPDALRDDDTTIFKLFYKLEQGQYLRRHDHLRQLIAEAGLDIYKEGTKNLRTAIPMSPHVARFSWFEAVWS